MMKTVDFCKTMHPVKTYAASVTNGHIKVSYSADTGYDEKIIKFFENSDYLICESSFLKNQKKWK